MYATQNSFPEASRSKVIDILQLELADAIDLMMQAKQAHLDVKGPSFIALHELFDKVSEDSEEYVDLIAERIGSTAAWRKARYALQPNAPACPSTT